VSARRHFIGWAVKRHQENPPTSAAARRAISANTSIMLKTPSGINVCSASVRATSGMNQSTASAVFSQLLNPRVKPSAARKAIAGASATKS
jgi:hypothetical protein